jgi:ribosomal protein L16 Arg81 hydroxylase
MSDNPIEQFFNDSHYSRLYEEFPDKKLFPKYYDAKKYEVILEKGEMLHIPAGWFHWVFSEKTDEPLNVAVNFWYKSEWDLGHNCTHTFFKFKYNQQIDYMKLLNEIKTPILVSQSDQKYFPEQRIRQYFPNISCTEHFMTFKEITEYSGDDIYASSYVDHRLRHYAPPWYNSDNLIQGGRWWINKGDVTTGLHFDAGDNWLYQLSGRKRIILFHPNDYDKLYMINHYNQHLLKEIRELYNNSRKSS